MLAVVSMRRTLTACLIGNRRLFESEVVDGLQGAEVWLESLMALSGFLVTSDLADKWSKTAILPPVLDASMRGTGPTSAHGPQRPVPLPTQLLMRELPTCRSQETGVTA